MNELSKIVLCKTFLREEERLDKVPSGHEKREHAAKVLVVFSHCGQSDGVGQTVIADEILNIASVGLLTIEDFGLVPLVGGLTECPKFVLGLLSFTYVLVASASKA